MKIGLNLTEWLPPEISGGDGGNEMQINTSELIGTALDWAVAASLNLQFNEGRVIKICHAENTNLAWVEQENYPGAYLYRRFDPSTNWARGGPIIEREDIAFRKYHKPESTNHGTYYARVCRESDVQVHWRKTTGFQHTGPTALIAAMRCYVASKLGDTVDVPDQLYRG